MELELRVNCGVLYAYKLNVDKCFHAPKHSLVFPLEGVSEGLPHRGYHINTHIEGD